MNKSMRFAPSTGVATGLVAPLALGAPGNLNPGFADHGRLFLDTSFGGEARAVEALDDGGVLVAGGDVDVQCHYWFYDCDFFGRNFADRLTDTGEADAAFASAQPPDIEVRDAIRQPDGKVIMVGRRIARTSINLNQFVVYRLDAGGALDTTFGVAGTFTLAPEEYGDRNVASGVVLDPDGRIVVSGSHDEQLVVVRLLADGTLDGSFGTAGVYLGPAHLYNAGAFIERTAAGGYRVTAASETECSVVALTTAGAIDNAFGTAGTATVVTPQGNALTCTSLAMQADGNLLLTGIAGGQAFSARMLATGAPDAGFAADSVAAGMSLATAIAVDGSGRVLVAGLGESGAMITRLAADGSLDAAFGEGGSTFIDLPSEYGALPYVNDLAIRADGRLLAAGGDLNFRQPFVVELLGDGGAGGAGVLSIVQPFAEVAEGTGVTFKVRRSGGSAGAVSVGYATLSDLSPSATVGDDYDAASGTLNWADGEAGEREVLVPVHADDGDPEEYEAFRIELSSAQGGAGLGTRNEQVAIQPDGAPAGQFAIEIYSPTEEALTGQVWVYRNYFYEGAVSVTVTPTAGTATAGDDFNADPVTLSWGDREGDPKVVEIGIVDDGDTEGAESLTVALSNPTGGAILGPRASGMLTIAASDQPIPPNPPRRGGGGLTGVLSLLFLGLMAACSSLARRRRRMTAA